MAVLISNGQARGLFQRVTVLALPTLIPIGLVFSPAGRDPIPTVPVASRMLRLVQAFLTLTAVFFSLLALFLVGKFSGDLSHHEFFFLCKDPKRPKGQASGSSCSLKQQFTTYLGPDLEPIVL